MDKEDALLILMDRTIEYFTLIIKLGVVAILLFGALYLIANIADKLVKRWIK